MDIQQAAEQLSISPDQIRHWEHAGIIPPIERNQQGFRQVEAADLEWLRFAKMLNQMHVSRDFQIEYVKLAQLGKEATPARVNLLKEQLATLKDDYQSLVDEIERIEGLVKERQAVNEN